MKTIRYTEEEGGKEAWLNGRLGKITGSKLKDIYSAKGGKKVGSYQLIAESILGSAALAEEEDPMVRGTRLEPESIERFRKETGKKVDSSLLLWVSDEDSRIAYSPDGMIGKKAAVETKSLSSAHHVEALITRKIPKDYVPQSRQAFVVNEKLELLYFVFYDPRFPAPLDFFYIELRREEIKDEIDVLLQFQKEELNWVREQVNMLTLYSPEERQKKQVEKELAVEDHRSALDKLHAGIKERALSQ